MSKYTYYDGPLDRLDYDQPPTGYDDPNLAVESCKQDDDGQLSSKAEKVNTPELTDSD